MVYSCLLFCNLIMQCHLLWSLFMQNCYISFFVFSLWLCNWESERDSRLDFALDANSTGVFVRIDFFSRQLSGHNCMILKSTLKSSKMGNCYQNTCTLKNWPSQSDFKKLANFTINKGCVQPLCAKSGSPVARYVGLSKVTRKSKSGKKSNR